MHQIYNFVVIPYANLSKLCATMKILLIFFVCGANQHPIKLVWKFKKKTTKLLVTQIKMTKYAYRLNTIKAITIFTYVIVPRGHKVPCHIHNKEIFNISRMHSY